MSRVKTSIEIAAPVGLAFRYVADYRHALDWMTEFSEFVPLSVHAFGLGARVRATGHLFGIRASATLEIVEFRENERIVSVTDGFIQSRSTWSFAETGTGTLVGFAGDYDFAKMPVPSFAEKLVLREVEERVRLSLGQLKKLVEAVWQASESAQDSSPNTSNSEKTTSDGNGA